MSPDGILTIRPYYVKYLCIHACSGNSITLDYYSILLHWMTLLLINIYISN